MSVLSVGVILGFMILIHEFGHYAVAKLLGVRVEQFRHWLWQTPVRLQQRRHRLPHQRLPLGGYVKMSGENPMDAAHRRSGRVHVASAMAPLPDRHRRPLMNILFAVGLLTCVYMVHYEYPAVFDEPAVIGWVLQDTPAAKAGIQVGDRIVRIDGIQNPTWEQVIPREA